ncbi:MAG TPA: DMT family transporter [Pirellulales bacterium]|nr:DMT family transporter [Pirellulales bacterium]
MNPSSDAGGETPPIAAVSPASTAGLHPLTWTGAALAILCAVLWGGLAVAVRYTQTTIPPLATAGLRFGISTLLLLLTAWWQGVSLRLSRHQLAAVVPVGFLLFLQIGSFHYGMAFTNSAHGSVMIGSYPVFVALVAHFLLHGDRVSLGKLLGLMVAFAGLVSIVAGASQNSPSAKDAPTLFGDAVVLTSSLLIGLNTVMSKRGLTVVRVQQLLFWSNLFATGLFFTTSALVEHHNWKFTAPAVWGLFYQSVVVAWLCFSIWTALLRQHRASQVAVFGFAQPLCGMGFGIWLRGDPLTASLAIGGAAVALGIILVTRAEG